MLSAFTHDMKALDNDLVLIPIRITHDTALASAAQVVEIDGSASHLSAFMGFGSVAVFLVSFKTGCPTTSAVQDSYFDTWTSPISGTDAASGSTPGALDKVMLGAFAHCDDLAVHITRVTATDQTLVIKMECEDVTGSFTAPADGAILDILLVFKNSGIRS